MAILEAPDGIGADAARTECDSLVRRYAKSVRAGRSLGNSVEEKTLPSVARLAAHAPARTLFTRFIPPANASEANGTWHTYYKKWSNVTRDRLESDAIELVPELRKYVPPANVIDRMVYSGFGGGRLLDFLTKHYVDTLIITGGETDVCVLSTVLSAIDFGYRIILVDDALCSSSDQSHDAILGLYRQRFDIQVGVAALEEILGHWRPE
jgi:nicotinamidase-related amidase